MDFYRISIDCVVELSYVNFMHVKRKSLGLSIAVLTLGVLGCSVEPTDGLGDEINTSFGYRAPTVKEGPYSQALALAREFVRETEGFRGAEVTGGTPIYRPDIEGPAYIEAKVMRDGKSAGFVLVSLGEHDAPVVAFSTIGPTSLETFRELEPAARAGEKFYRLGPANFVAESKDGVLLAHTFHLILDDGAWQRIRKEYATTFATQLDGVRAVHIADWQRVRVEMPEMRPMPGVNGLRMQARGGTLRQCLNCNEDAPGPAPSTGKKCKPIEKWARGINPSESNQPTPLWNQFLTPNPDSYGGAVPGLSLNCWSGCSPTALAIFLGWINNQPANKSDNSLWSQPKYINAYTDENGNHPFAPMYWYGDEGQKSFVREIRGYLRTYCQNEEPYGGATSNGSVSDYFSNYLSNHGIDVHFWTYDGDLDSHKIGMYQAFDQQRPMFATGPTPAPAESGKRNVGEHAYIIQGYRFDCRSEFVHLNLGWGGAWNHWEDFNTFAQMIDFTGSMTPQ